MKKQPSVWRTTYEVPERKWPVVSRKAFGDLQLNGVTNIPENWNPLVKALASGYVQLYNVKLWAVSARRRAYDAGKNDLGKELDARIAELKATLENWPMEIVG